MSLAALLLAAALNLPAPALPDDPAVTVCEMLVRQGLRVPGSFARSGAPVVAGDGVTLTYSFVDVRGRAVSETRSCRFRLGADGRFHVEPFRRDYLASRMAAAQRRLIGTKTQNELMLARSEILDIGREMFVQDDRLKKAERLAAKAGIYPIAPGRTGLKAK